MSEKPLGHKSYGSIPHLSGSRLGEKDYKCNPGQEMIATEKPRDKYDLVIVSEKVDGSNCSCVKLNGQLIPLTRGGLRAEKSVYEQHRYFAKFVFKHYNRFNELLKEGERLVGEWMLMAHGTKYNLPHEPYVVFDIMYNKHERLPYIPFIERIAKYDFIKPRLLHIGQPIDVKRILKILNPSGHGAIDPVEGAVWRVERIRENKVDFLVKYVKPEKEDGIYLPEITGEKSIWNVDPKNI